MNNAKLTLEQRKANARNHALGWRLMAVSAGTFAAAVLLHPLGIALLGQGGVFLLAADAMALISLAAALVAALSFRPWRNVPRTRAILLMLLTIILSNLYLLTWDWRLPG